MRLDTGIATTAEAPARETDYRLNGRESRPITLWRVARPDAAFAQNAPCSTSPDCVAEEGDLVLRVCGGEEYRLCRTPGDDVNLAVGHLFIRGVLRDASQIRALRVAENGLRAEIEVELEEAPPFQCTPFGRDQRINKLSPALLFALRDDFENRQLLYRRTGAAHGAGLYTARGELLTFGEDVGRHNAFDKAIGSALNAGRLHRAAIAMLSSRLALDLVQKAECAGVAMLAGFSVATSAALDCAAAAGITLIGRLRDRSMNVYTHPGRLLPD